MRRMLGWMHQIQAPDGSWTPLWFGDQDAKDERSPVYGTAMAVEYLSLSNNPLAQEMAQKGLRFLLASQNEDGGWGGAKGVRSKVTLTARALSALASFSEVDNEPIERGFYFLYEIYEKGQIYRAEPIGLYFSRLWYSEEMYNITFVLNALKNKIEI